jgi:hypothetical protein
MDIDQAWVRLPRHCQGDYYGRNRYGETPQVIVDFAHTQNAARQSMRTLHRLIGASTACACTEERIRVRQVRTIRLAPLSSITRHGQTALLDQTSTALSNPPPALDGRTTRGVFLHRFHSATIVYCMHPILFAGVFILHLAAQ